jgi:hypothetical protein
MAEESKDFKNRLLDVTSKSFDPYAALYSEKCIADPSAPVLDNVEAFISQYNGRGRGQHKKKCIEIQPGVSMPDRQFTEDQMHVPGNNNNNNNNNNTKK